MTGSASASNEVWNSEEPESTGNFIKQYILVRQAEGRVYTDEQVRRLPDIDPHHIHYREWLIRKRSCKRLFSYLAKKNKALTILEPGCGNGWLSGQLSTVPHSEVTGLDINEAELLQAKKVFETHQNLRFQSGNFANGLPVDVRFDIIVFAAAVQYFSPLSKIMNIALRHLTPGGEIHITDTPFYEAGKTDAARQRTAAYYASLGFPGLAAYYFHHCIDDLRVYDPVILHDPTSLKNKLFARNDPFYWILVKKDKNG